MSVPKSEPPPDAATAQLVADIEKTRSDMSGAVAALGEKLSPTELRGKLDGELQHVEDKVRQVVREQLADAKALVKEELVEAKNLLRDEMNEAEKKIKEGLASARDTAKKDLAEQLEGAEAKLRKGVTDAKDGLKEELSEAMKSARHTVRAQTIGRVEDLATTIGDTMNDSKQTLVDTIRENPIPAALAGLGIAWLFMNRSSSSRRSQGNGIRVSSRHTFDGASGSEFGNDGGQWNQRGPLDVGGAVHQAKDAAGRALHDATDAVGSMAHTASDAVGSMAHQAYDAAGGVVHGASDIAGRAAAQTSHAASALVHGAQDVTMGAVHAAGDAATYLAKGARTQAGRVEKQFETTLHDNPLALGAAAVAVGALIGYALPSTRGEDRLMGAARDGLLHRAEEVASDATHVAEEFAEKSVATASELLGAGRSNSKEPEASAKA